jgi:hypothetical protein
VSGNRPHQHRLRLASTSLLLPTAFPLARLTHATCCTTARRSTGRSCLVRRPGDGFVPTSVRRFPLLNSSSVVEGHRSIRAQLESTGANAANRSLVSAILLPGAIGGRRPAPCTMAKIRNSHLRSFENMLLLPGSLGAVRPMRPTVIALYRGPANGWRGRGCPSPGTILTRVAGATDLRHAGSMLPRKGGFSAR